MMKRQNDCFSEWNNSKNHPAEQRFCQLKTHNELQAHVRAAQAGFLLIRENFPPAQAVTGFHERLQAAGGQMKIPIDFCACKYKLFRSQFNLKTEKSK